MATKADIESYLIQAGLESDEIEEGTWVIRGQAAHVPDVVLRVDEPIVVYRMRVIDLPESDLAPFMRKLLVLNAREMLHASFGLEDDVVVLGGAHQLENLDFNEFQAMLDDMYVAINRHFESIRDAARA
jgi:hypothetical protein